MSLMEKPPSPAAPAVPRGAPPEPMPTTAMTHIAIQAKLDGKAVDWLEHVTVESRTKDARARLACS